MIAREEDLGPKRLFLQKMRLEYVFRLEEGSREAEGESDEGNSQRKQVGRERRDGSWTEEVPPPQADRRLEWMEVRVAVARLLDVTAIKRENHGVLVEVEKGNGPVSCAGRLRRGGRLGIVVEGNNGES